MLGTKKSSNLATEELARLRDELGTLKARLESLEVAASRKPPAINIADVCSIRPPRPLAEPIGTVRELAQKETDIDHFSGIDHEVHLEAFMDRDLQQVPALEDREHYFPGQDLDYWLSGLRDYLRINQELENAGRPLNAGDRLFDFGAASGRVLRHFAAQQPDIDLACADVNENHVEWVSKHLASDAYAFQCTNIPSLPIEDNSFDLVYAFSVFTHMDELETTWLAELRRILRPGGYAYFSVQTEDTWKLLNPDHFLYGHLLYNQANLPDWEIKPELFENPMPSEKVVFRFENSSVYNTCTFQSKAYVKEVWGRFFDIEKILYCGHDFQDVVLMRKPN
ncbi:class I SAM-dependent methyltransferase [Rubellicoccus peritrichatus]|uniref:Class I SAM-dependent methyltransferase n=1 Tax=Rubellicoccus peritrichatus TaxID=3080537 RepID=A0AAQ3L5K0_9BACT|nr:class I SAM-dependent methyltransferase [Puniceicoccus sp. CR14]WOO39839.1 class I SAM-dependent methyltransferase [Puniceicoccus sp. CR14]